MRGKTEGKNGASLQGLEITRVQILVWPPRGWAAPPFPHRGFLLHKESDKMHPLGSLNTSRN